MRSLALLVLGASLALFGCASPKPRAAIPDSGRSAATPASPSAEAPAPRTDTAQGSGPAAAEPVAPAAPVAPPPASKPSAAAPARPKGSVKPAPAVSSAPAPAPAPAAAAAREPKPPAAPQLDLTSLEQRLRDTRAIGVFTKLSLKNQVDDLLAVFRAYHAGRGTVQLPELRQRYDLLLLKVLSLLQDGDPALATAVSSSREAIWAILIDPQQFARVAKL
jgi:hypothetical protein